MLKSHKKWAEDERLHGVTREDAAAVALEIQADALRHAARECRRRISFVKNNAANMAYEECATFIEADEARLYAQEKD